MGGCLPPNPPKNIYGQKERVLVIVAEPCPCASAAGGIGFGHQQAGGEALHFCGKGVWQGDPADRMWWPWDIKCHLEDDLVFQEMCRGLEALSLRIAEAEIRQGACGEFSVVIASFHMRHQQQRQGHDRPFWQGVKRICEVLCRTACGQVV
jgi:hypothetical protein